jgi:LmbE family N-acetylglucosaminyl deacetylase
VRKLHRLTIERGEESDWDPEVLGTPEEKISAVIDVREFVSKKMEALYCHQSQMNPNSIFRRMPKAMREEAFGYEHFVCALGCTSANGRETDLFEGIPQ